MTLKLSFWEKTPNLLKPLSEQVQFLLIWLLSIVDSNLVTFGVVGSEVGVLLDVFCFPPILQQSAFESPFHHA
jgi:hypothetical protein